MDYDDKIPTLKDLFPNFSEEELARAEAAFEDYIDIALGIWEDEHRPSLTEDEDLRTMADEGEALSSDASPPVTSNT